MNDLISRQAAIDAIKKIHPVDTEYDCTLYDKVDVMYVLKDLPPVTPKQKMGHWIPTSERLPEDGQNVLFCDIDEDIMLGYHVKGRPDTHFSQAGSWDDMKNVFAWMPLPEPYKAESEVSE